MSKTGIQNRILLITLLPNLILSVLLCIYMIHYALSTAERAQAINGHALLSHIVNNSRKGLLMRDTRFLKGITHFFMEENELKEITFYGPNREVLAYGGKHNPQLQKRIQFDSEKISVYRNQDTITLTSPVILDTQDLATRTHWPSGKTGKPGKRLIGWVSIDLSSSSLLLSEYRAIDFTLILLAAGFLISLWLAHRTTDWLNHSFARMRTALQQIGRGHPEHRIHPISGGETGELETEINQVASIIEQGRDRLLRKIERMSAELTSANSTINAQKAALVAAEKSASDTVRTQADFVTALSHEIRTPMNGIMGFTSLLLETEMTQLQRNYLGTIQKSALNMLNLVNNILDISRLDAGELKLEQLSFDVRDCIDDVLSILSPLANEKQLEFVALVDPEIPARIIGDPLRLRQIIMNLAANAIKFTDQGEVIIRANAEKRLARSTRLRISISDTGPGLSNEARKRVFHAFQQADATIARKYGGTGLGLSICRKLIRQMGGRIGTENKPQQGATFWFTFSAANADNGNHPEQGETPDTEILAEKPFYVYDSHPVTRNAICRILHDWKAIPHPFDSPDALIDELKNNQQQTSQSSPFMLITGISQHECKTMAAIHPENIRKYFSGPLVVMTNATDQAMVNHFLATGATLCLAKTVTRNTLRHALNRLVPGSPNPWTATSLPAITGKKILCVDDNIHNTALLSELLGGAGAHAVIASNSAEALRFVRSGKFDLILMDLHMPGRDGRETVREIRVLPDGNAHIPIIALSAHIADHEIHKLLTQGFNDCLTKPFTRESLFKILQNWLPAGKSIIEPVIDHTLALSLSNHKKEVADEMLALLCETLPEEIRQISQALANGLLVEAQQFTHRLHGAICYCGVPRLKKAVAALEEALKARNSGSAGEKFKKFEEESLQLLRLFKETQNHQIVNTP